MYNILSLNGFSPYAVWVVAGIIDLILIALIIRLFRERTKLRHELRLLIDAVNRNNKDIMGLCSAAITIDKRLLNYEETLTGIQAKLLDVKQAEPVTQPYHSVIQKVQSGASAAELMKNYGLSRDEASLLIRLHSPKTEYE